MPLKDAYTNNVNLDGLAGKLEKKDPWSHQKSKESGFTLQQNVFNGGRTVMAVQIAKYSIEAGRAALLSTEQAVLLNAITAYLEVIKSQQMLEINKENVQSYEKKLEAVRQEAEAGVKKQSDLAEANAAKANAYTRLAQAQGAYDSALATYLKMTNLPAENLKLEANLSSVPANQMELLQNALKANPELSSITLQQKAAEINVVSNAAALLPSVDIGGSISKNWSHRSGSSFEQPYTNSKSVFIQVSVPIYQQGLEYSNTRAASANAVSLKYTVKNTKADVTQKATQAWSHYVATKEAVLSAAEAVKSGEIGLEGVQQGYDEGVQTLTDLLTTAENLFQYKLTLTQAQQEAELSRYSMAALMGKLNARELALPTKIYNMSANYDKIKSRLVGF